VPERQYAQALSLARRFVGGIKYVDRGKAQEGYGHGAWEYYRGAIAGESAIEGSRDGCASVVSC